MRASTPLGGISMLLMCAPRLSLAFSGLGLRRRIERISKRSNSVTFQLRDTKLLLIPEQRCRGGRRSNSRVSLSTAAVRTGDVTSISLFYNDVYRVDLPEGHRFPMDKYRLVREGLQRELQLSEDEIGPRATFTVSPLASLEDLCTTHDPDYVQRYFDGRFTARENRVVGFPWSEASVRRSVSSVGGTIEAMHVVCKGRKPPSSSGRVAVTRGRAAEMSKSEESNRLPPLPQALFAGHIAGGTHHAFRDRGEGFCVFSDIAVAANVALRDYPDTIRKILIVDCDVHQGNGNARLFADNSAVVTFSIHCKANYFSPIEKSDLDIEVEEGAGDERYMSLLSQHLPSLVQEIQPDLIFYQGGVDPLVYDRLGRLNLTREGLRQRNRLVYQACIHTPTVATMGGGYPRDLDPGSKSFAHIVTSHQDVYLDAAQTLDDASCARQLVQGHEA